MDSFKTLKEPAPEILYKDRKSKFFGYAYPIVSENEVKPLVESLRKQHHTANHVCYAWQLGTDQIRYRANDDGEPNNSAGMPIYGQIQAHGLTNVLVAVVRIFGGTKLGVGGLIQAYKTAAQETLAGATVVEQLVKSSFKLEFGYPEMDKVMRTIKQNKIQIAYQEMAFTCNMTVAVRKSEAEQTHQLFEQMQNVKITSID